jgi:hypothetical protein
LEKTDSHRRNAKSLANYVAGAERRVFAGPEAWARAIEAQAPKHMDLSPAAKDWIRSACAGVRNELLMGWSIVTAQWNRDFQELHARQSALESLSRHDMASKAVAIDSLRCGDRDMRK